MNVPVSTPTCQTTYVDPRGPVVEIARLGWLIFRSGHNVLAMVERTSIRMVPLTHYFWVNPASFMDFSHILIHEFLLRIPYDTTTIHTNNENTTKANAISVFARLGKIYDLSKFIVYRKHITIRPVTILEPMKIDRLMKLVKCCELA